MGVKYSSNLRLSSVKPMIYRDQIKKLAGIVLMAVMVMAFSGSVKSQCRMTEDQLRPIIDRYNPFFTDHTWENSNKTEMARLDQFRLLMIRQKACLRHHVLFSMHIDPSVITNTDRFWIREMLVMLKRVYFTDPTYLEYQAPFEKEFIRQFLAHGLNRTFTFPINDRTFICVIEHGDWGAKLKMESVKFILAENVKQPGISRDQDDGWFEERRRR